MMRLIRSSTEENIFASIEDVRNAYPTIDESDFSRIIRLDPTYQEGKDKVGKYSKWLLNLFKKGNLKLEDEYKVSEYLKDFEDKRANLPNKDIMTYKSLSQLAAALSEVELTDRQKQRRLQSKVRKSIADADKVYEDSQWVVYIPRTFEADRALAQLDNPRSNHWCTAANEDYFDHYSSQGPLYVNINKLNDEHYQFHFPTRQFMNNEDEPVALLDVFGTNKGMVHFYAEVASEYSKELANIDTSSEVLDFDVQDIMWYHVFEGANHETWARYGINHSIIYDLLIESGEATIDLVDQIVDSMDYSSYSEDSYMEPEFLEILRTHGFEYENLQDALEDSDIRDAYTQAVREGFFSGIYNQIREIVLQSVRKSLRDTSCFVDAEHTLSNLHHINVLNPFYISTSGEDDEDLRLLATLDSESEDNYYGYYNISQDNVLGRCLMDLMMTLAANYPEEPYNGFDEFDEDSFRDCLNSML